MVDAGGELVKFLCAEIMSNVLLFIPNLANLPTRRLAKSFEEFSLNYVLGSGGREV